MGLTTTLMAIGTAVAVGGQLYAGSQAAKASEYNAQLADQQAMNERQRGQIESDRQRRDAARLASRSRAKIGKSGVTATGSPLEVIADNAEEAEYDALLTQWSSNTRASAFTAQGVQDRRSTSNSRIGSYIGAGTTFLTGSAKMFKQIKGA